MTLASPPLALYVHFPWCVRKCPYCDFNSYTLREELPESRYVQALGCDLEAQAEGLDGRVVTSIFLGGGTPSLFSPQAIGQVLAQTRAVLALAEDVEITLEANPGTIERGRFAEYRSAGINRVSLGAQSFDARRLEVLGRIHSPVETTRAAEELHAAGLVNFNLDLMYALPGQDVTGAVRDLEEALALEPAHLSHYQLTLEAGTPFAAEPPPGLPTDDAAAEMLAQCETRLAAHGFDRYETSAYARAGRQCRHNRNYWAFGDYLGVGAGAHGKLTDPIAGVIVRTTQPRDPRRYLARVPHALARTPIAARDLPFEFMLNALRLTGGFEASLLTERTGLRWEVVAPIMRELEQRDLVTHAGQHWRPTALGARFLNEILVRFLPDAPTEAALPGVSRLSTGHPVGPPGDTAGLVIHSAGRVIGK
jgi:oxygen-independent coproporphyrinogen-3 oxidase